MTGQFASLDISEQSANPWEVPTDQKSTLEQKPIIHNIPTPPSLDKEDSGNEAWSSIAPPTRAAPVPALSEPPMLIDVDDGQDSPTWDDDEPDLFPTSAGERVVTQDAENAWEDVTVESGTQGHISAPATGQQEDLLRDDGGWETLEAGEHETGIVDATGVEHTSLRSVPARPPDLPPREPVGSRDAVTRQDQHSTGDASAATPGQDREAQAKETYEIKKISWHDSRTTANPRITPILTQNANGPCPLLALVNALTLSTPPGLNTPLIETLRTREQVSLELLLNAVFDELMSGRRGDGMEELPDVSDLYTFLITLHTGMNVNPSFFPPTATNSTTDPRRSMSHVHPSERDESIPGTFEQTRELKLYSTFAIPLIHGWLPEPGSPAHTALARSARTYEDAQNLMFREEELETKLSGEGLNFEEQATLEDIATVKAFFVSSATQLTHSGLETIRKGLAPGSFAILFRNDHFSTLYKHPHSELLLHLVTDMGFAGHDEVVWESLPDINGENCEFFSGDFRPVGGDPHARQAVTGDGEGGTIVQGHQRTSEISNAAGHQPIQPSASEQEDHDLALALQLQEEEEERHRAETSRRRRESQLSQEYIEQQGTSHGRNNSGTDIPVSRFDGAGGRRPTNGRGWSQENRPPIPQRRSNTMPTGGEALPSYAQAATQPRYEPPLDHPAHTGLTPEGMQGQGGARRASAQRADSWGGAARPPNRRASQVPQERGRDRDCVVM